MNNVVRIKGSQFHGYNIAEAIDRLASTDPECRELTERAYFVMKNGEFVSTEDYESVVIEEEDEVILLPLITGGGKLC